MGFSPRNLSRSLPTDPHSPHACSTPGVYTFSVTWTVLRLLTSLALGYSNRPDRKSPGSVAATGFLPGVLSFLCALSPLERDAHRPKPPVHPTSTPLSPGEREFHNWSQAIRSPALRGHNNPWETDTSFLKLVQRWQIDLTVTASEQRSYAQARSRAVDAHGFSRHNTGFSGSKQR
jgi:hypothetical protein